MTLTFDIGKKMTFLAKEDSTSDDVYLESLLFPVLEVVDQKSHDEKQGEDTDYDDEDPHWREPAFCQLSLLSH